MIFGTFEKVWMNAHICIFVAMNICYEPIVFYDITFILVEKGKEKTTSCDVVLFFIRLRCAKMP